tara:strand:- start:2642 stop:4789 length:2148 start_codon:yes stop_codon:yes gene_type:complete
MAKKRRSYKISSGDYNIAGGGGAETTASTGSFIKIAKGHPQFDHADHDGFIANGSTVTVMVDVGTTIPTKDDYLYIDNAFETETGNFTIEYVAPTTALPSGVSWTHNSDSTDTDMGETRIYGSPNSGTEGTYTMKIKGGYPRGRPDEQMEITWVLKVLPQGTTPQFAVDLPDQIIRNTSGEQDIVAAPTTTYADATFTLSNVSGFHSSVTPVIDPATGRVYLNNVGDIQQAASLHTLTITVDLGPYGTASKTYSKNVAYGDPYGSMYWGPANARTYFSDNAGPYDEATSRANYHNHDKTSGALRRMNHGRYDTSPYMLNDGYGCTFVTRLYQYWNNTYADDMSGYTGNGIMGPMGHDNNYWVSGSNYRCVRYTWIVPNGVDSICAVAVGAGAGGAYSWSSDGAGGGGLAWMNGIEVTPGEMLEISVGIGRQSESGHSSYGGGNSYLRRTQSNPTKNAGQCIIFAGGGGYQPYNGSSPNGQTFNGVTISGINSFDRGNTYNFGDSRDGGGFGHNTSEGTTVAGFHYGGGKGQRDNGSRIGAGAGGYRGSTHSYGNSQEGSYGGGGSGYYYSSTYGVSGGGGTGLDGQGWRGVHGDSIIPRTNNQAGSGYGGSQGAWTSYSDGSSNYLGAGGGGSGGSRANYGESQYANSEFGGHRTRNGGLHGGGGGGSGTSWGGGHGASGGVRIIWGNGADGSPRAFPYQYCSERPDMKYNGEGT